MEEKRAKTLEALQTFIQSQKALLERTQSDIERLKELRREVENHPEDALERLSDKLNASSLKLSEQLDYMPPVPKEVDWSVYKSADPAPFKALAASSRQTYEMRNQPSTTQRSELSELQKLVKDARASMLLPVFNSLGPLEPASSDDESDLPDREELHRAREREKIKELKKRRIDSDAAASVFSGLRRPRASQGVFIRRDQEDESADVDISCGDQTADGEGEPSMPGSGSEVVPMDVDTPPTSVASPASAMSGLPAVLPEKAARERRPTRAAPPRVVALTAPSGRGASRVKLPAKREPETAEVPVASPAIAVVSQTDKTGKPRSETYKQAWSVSEQHLLERLLEEIPDGEKNRWAKISKAMNGRRTARQVASRVQKYYEKLKRFGVELSHSMATQFDANNAQNLIEIEKQFAVKAVEHAQPTLADILEHPREGSPTPAQTNQAGRRDLRADKNDFPELFENDYEKITKIDEDMMKSEDGKKSVACFHPVVGEKGQRPQFRLSYSDRCATGVWGDQYDFCDTNTSMSLLYSFYAYEIARNKLGLNDAAHEIAREEAAKEKAKAEKEAEKAKKKKTNSK
ncbi:ZZ-type zinc finger-containing protein 3 [Grifola frondosa]|uniref:ZZ-type zinc finger-containing protein 3 n=1 Tax=Grifola frondosa TaxID=5627 RepID=A0A1C7MKC1_GRIFR|nr:ZZ-type zinc finger-containing protein 3 [Grifola frondosa]